MKDVNAFCLRTPYRPRKMVTFRMLLPPMLNQSHSTAPVVPQEATSESPAAEANPFHDISNALAMGAERSSRMRPGSVKVFAVHDVSCYRAYKVGT
ncbi:hypothetical protein Hypma_005538 [Hypsizygus marmoreus]|uniref:Uncharacterized protein n=1 Tax=Hypsizygus marmoreus TaxID=39966 RepID=A0A369K218_HYPMA|nr:hypothetical protein Hypma_005538 [Hypsizygus marmoreus]